MDVMLESGGNTGTSDGTRKQRAGGRRRRTRSAATLDDSAAVEQIGGGSDVAVEKILHPGPATATGVSVSVSVKQPVAIAPAPVSTPVPAPIQIGGSVAPNVVIAPPKKRPPKLLLVPSIKKPTGGMAARTAALQKTFKAHKVRVLIDNTAKTQKRRRQTLQAVEAMTEDQLRAAAVATRLSRRETVEKVPVDLLRQMLKDYRMMRGMLL
jgi:hypothetical protein